MAVSRRATLLWRCGAPIPAFTLKVVKEATFFTSGGKRVVSSVHGVTMPPSVLMYSPVRRHTRTE